MENIIDSYDVHLPRYESYSKFLSSLIESLILNQEIKTHSISSRVKNRKSTENKILIKGKYQSIEDITDIVGVRIVTHYADEVDLIASIIENEFIIDKEKSIDKRASLAPDRFGYLSLHYIVSLSENRSSLSENMRFKGLKAEIQIRSILQHTWAEIEHDTGYKTSIEVPKHIRRKFSRLASLLELADEQFISIKKELLEYEKKTDDEFKKENNDTNIDMEINKITYEKFLMSSKIVNEIKIEIENECLVRLSPRASETSSANALRQLAYHDIKTTLQLNQLFKENRDLILKRAFQVLKKKENSDKKYPLEVLGIYLSQVLSAKNKDPEEIRNFLDCGLVNSPDEIKKMVAKSLMEL